MKQDLKESKTNVNNRIQYIQEEVKRHEDQIKDMEAKQESQREVIGKLQAQMQANKPASFAAAAAAAK
jgi:peptidoglycan hydrolase CwlO-like protein